MLIGLIVSKKIKFLWKNRKNFSFACHWGRKDDVAQKILTPQSSHGQIICSVDCRVQSGMSSFSMLPIVWAVGPRKWNFSVSYAHFLMNFCEFWPKYWSYIKMSNLQVVDLQKIMWVCFLYFFCGTVRFRENWIFHKNRSEISVTTLLNWYFGQYLEKYLSDNEVMDRCFVHWT